MGCMCWWYCIWEYGICWWYDIWEYEKTTVCGMVCVDGMVREKHIIYMVLYVCGMVYHGTMSWMYYFGLICLVVWYVSVYKVHKGRIRRTNIICNELIHRPLKSVRKYKPCGQTDRQTDRQICFYQNRDSVLQTENTLRPKKTPETKKSLTTYLVCMYKALAPRAAYAARYARSGSKNTSNYYAKRTKANY